jgi:alginate O-acetyltransferase complex protein AlgJ
MRGHFLTRDANMSNILPAVSRRSLVGATLAAPFLATQAQATAPSRQSVNGVFIGQEDWLFASWDVLRGGDPAAIRRVTGLMSQTAATLRAAGIQVAIVLLPSRARLHSEYLPRGVTLKRDGIQRHGLALKAFREQGVLVPDLATVLAEARKQNPGHRFFFKADTHWLPSGAEIAATAFANQIRANIPLPASSQPGTRFGPPEEGEQACDLGRLLPPPLNRQYSTEGFHFRPVLQDGLLDDTAELADVAVLGNSYMHPRYGFAAMLSYQLQQPVALSWNVNQVGPYRTMLNYLASPAFRQRRPKLITWTIHELDLEVMPDSHGSWEQNSMPNQQFTDEVRRRLSV